MPRFATALFLIAFVLPESVAGQSLWSTSDPSKAECDYVPSRGEEAISCLLMNREAVEYLAKGGDTVSIDLDGTPVNVVDAVASIRDDGNSTVTGRLEGERFATFLISIVDGAAAGSFTQDGQLFEVRPTKAGQAVLLRVDKAARRVSVHDALIPEFMPRLPEQRGARKGGVSAQIDMLLLWDDGVLAANGAAGLAALEASFVDYLNQAVSNGGSQDVVFNVIHSEVITYNESQFADMGDDLTSMADGSDGVLDEAHTLREQHGADLVHLLLPSFKGDTCGIAYQSFTGANLGFGVTGVDGCGMETFAHEVGHNMGMGHDVYVSPEPQDAFQLWSYGYVDLNNAVHTIMAYDNECFDNGVNCSVLPYFSDPDASASGVPLGVADAPPNKAANNFRVLMETAENRASFSDIVDSCVADVYSGETGPSSAAQGEELQFAVAMAQNSLATNCSGDPSFSIYITGSGLDTYFVGRRTVALTESPQYYDIVGTPLNPAPPPGTYGVLLYDDAAGWYYNLSLQLEITQGTGVNTEESGIPGSYQLLSAYPNPFNPQTSITFETAGAHPVSIRVYDTLGRELSVLVRSEQLAAGAHTVRFDASALPSGTYIVRLQAGVHTDVLPVTLLR